MRKLPALPSYHTTHPPFRVLLLLRRPPGSVSLIIPRPFLPVITTTTTTRFFTVQLPHSASLSSHSPPVCESVPRAVRTLLWSCCLVVRFFPSFIGLG